MASNKTDGAQIQSDKQAWGVQLTLFPFAGITGSENSSMSIIADVNYPKKGRNSVIKVRFSGVRGSISLTVSNATVWASALLGVIEEAKRVAATLQKKAAATKR
jgi:hypothetical protein